jgi:transposase
MREVLMGRAIGLDVHRDFCEIAIADGGRARSAGRVATTPDRLKVLACSLLPDDRVVLEATGNALAIARILEPWCAEVVIAHTKQVRAISHARVKTDKIDARVLADLLAADLIPRVWVGDERVRALRRLVSRRRGLVKRRTQIKNEIAAVLQRNLKPRPPVTDLFGVGGREWLADQVLPVDERLTVDGCDTDERLATDPIARPRRSPRSPRRRSDGAGCGHAHDRLRGFRSSVPNVLAPAMHVAAEVWCLPGSS